MGEQKRVEELSKEQLAQERAAAVIRARSGISDEAMEKIQALDLRRQEQIKNQKDIIERLMKKLNALKDIIDHDERWCNLHACGRNGPVHNDLKEALHR